MDGINCLWKTGDIYVLVTWRYVVPRSKILLSEEQLQLARKCDWISLRADIICFVRQPVFLKFRSRKLNARKLSPRQINEHIIYIAKYMPPGELETHSLVCDAMDGINCLWKTRNIYLLVTWHYVVPRSKTLLSEEQLQLARKRDWISLRADIICFVSWTVFLMFRSRKFAYFGEQIIFMDKFTSIYFQAK